MQEQLLQQGADGHAACCWPIPLGRHWAIDVTVERAGSTPSDLVSRQHHLEKTRPDRTATLGATVSAFAIAGLLEMEVEVLGFCLQGCAFGPCGANWILATQNGRAGAYLGKFYRINRTLDGDGFFVDVNGG